MNRAPNPAAILDFLIVIVQGVSIDFVLRLESLDLCPVFCRLSFDLRSWHSTALWKRKDTAQLYCSIYIQCLYRYIFAFIAIWVVQLHWDSIDLNGAFEKPHLIYVCAAAWCQTAGGRGRIGFCRSRHRPKACAMWRSTSWRWLTMVGVNFGM